MMHTLWLLYNFVFRFRIFLLALTQSECHKGFQPAMARQRIVNNLLNRYANMKKLLCEYEE